MRMMKSTVLAFIERINAHDVEGIVGMLDEDYRFIGSSGDAFRGIGFMRASWAAHFRQYPDFHIEVDRVLGDDGSVAVFGMMRGTLSRDGELWDENYWEVPAAFKGVAEDGKMVHWQVYSDTTMIFDVVGV